MDIRSELLKKKVSKIAEKANENNKYSMFNVTDISKVFDSDIKYDAKKSIYEIALSWEPYLNLPYAVGVSLDFLSQDPDYIVCIHRAFLSLDRTQKGLQMSDSLEDVMSNGLINYGHKNAYGGSAVVDVPDLTLCMTPLKGIGGWVNFASPWHDNDSIVIASFPRAKYDENGKLISGIVNDNGEIVDYSRINEIYDFSYDDPRVKPECIAGVILKKDNSFDEFYTTDEVLKQVSDKKNNKI